MGTKKRIGGKVGHIRKDGTYKGMETGLARIHSVFLGDHSISLVTKYTGTEEEVAEADRITAAIFDKALSKTANARHVLLQNAATDHMTRGLDIAKRDELRTTITNAGFALTDQGIFDYYTSNKGFDFIRNAKTAKEIIDKYKEKVPKDYKKRFKVTTKKG